MSLFLTRLKNAFFPPKQELPKKEVFLAKDIASIKPVIDTFLFSIVEKRKIDRENFVNHDIKYISLFDIFRLYDPEFRAYTYKKIFIQLAGPDGIMLNDRNKTGDYEIADSRLYGLLVETRINLLGCFGDAYRQLEMNYLKALDEHNAAFGIKPWFSVSKEPDHFVVPMLVLIRHFMIHDFEKYLRKMMAPSQPTQPPKPTK